MEIPQGAARELSAAALKPPDKGSVRSNPEDSASSQNCRSPSNTGNVCRRLVAGTKRMIPLRARSRRATVLSGDDELLATWSSMAPCSSPSRPRRAGGAGGLAARLDRDGARRHPELRSGRRNGARSNKETHSSRCGGEVLRSRPLSITSILRMQATSATFAGLPPADRRR